MKSKIIAVTDAGEKHCDRYTIWLTDGSYLGLSSMPDNPQGFSQWGDYKGSAWEIIKENREKVISLETLPDNVRVHALARMS